MLPAGGRPGLYTCFTIFAIPYLAWGAELARDYHERTTVVQVRSLLGIVGGVVGASFADVIASRSPIGARLRRDGPCSASSWR